MDADAHPAGDVVVDVAGGEEAGDAVLDGGDGGVRGRQGVVVRSRPRPEHFVRVDQVAHEGGVADHQSGLGAGGRGEVRGLPVEHDQAVDRLLHRAYFQVLRAQVVQIGGEAPAVAHRMLVEVAQASARLDDGLRVLQPRAQVGDHPVAARLSGEDFASCGAGRLPQRVHDPVVPVDDGDRRIGRRGRERGEGEQGVEERGGVGEVVGDLARERDEEPRERGRCG
ncbi:hypothetical protein [Streptomyces sp. NRRL F-2202]|uniref:hypothetical protein n=1 Tax=Streptomyces sp. NRRL F-2202 TaxID=1463839 RepID=UPI00131C0E4B|nr:hypothetical protein [Streptomyces sp. NRRL F-2202]